MQCGVKEVAFFCLMNLAGRYTIYTNLIPGKVNVLPPHPLQHIG